MNFPVSVFIKVDTGYHRVGLPPAALNKDGLLQKLADAEKQIYAKLLGIYSHSSLSCAGTKPQEAMQHLIKEIDGCKEGLQRHLQFFPEKDLVIGVGATPQALSSQFLLQDGYPGLHAQLPFCFLRGGDRNVISENTKTRLVIPVGGTLLGIPMHLKIGPSFFDLLANFPDAKYVIDILMFHNDLSNSLLFAKAANRLIGASNIYAWEIGDEPDNYRNTGADWNEKQLRNSQTYQAVALSSQTGVTGTPGGDADSWKIYQIKANEPSDLKADLMNHDEVNKGTAIIK
ncbi:hypothetical protein BDV34DRAFT_228528 [Aspergillus parasiticus]|uniref:Alanine racemase N-terminal domain-containing protein n=1 Tax=Aspergillus parasiticus TaxID=5067 RepID=A0A5N6DD18_ASPPA|nr:hypothetical protein BDV34DRAFT_228528 [Aspergillus parasiticus]